MPAKPEQFSDFPPGPRGGPESRDWKLWQSDLSAGHRTPGPQGDSGQCCVYNQTCERFLSADVEAADFTQSGLETRLQTLSPAAGKALWLVPFRGISPTSVRMPVDLIYLDRDCVVIEAVESFPIFRVSASSRPAASVLVLPPQSIASTSTRAGDQLIFRTPAEMKLVLEQLAKMQAEDKQGRAGAQISGQGAGHILPWKDLSRPEPQQPAYETTITPREIAPGPPPLPSLEISAQSALDVSAQAASKPLAEPAPQIEEPWRKKRGWLERFLSSEPDDKRTALRESIPGLTAYFFTGGAPVPHGIRDVSETGMFVLTEERWYPGTVVRITLTDQREPTAERSFTVNAVVMRWGNDGVGLHFVFQDKKDLRRRNLSAQDRAMGVADAATFKQFLGTLKGEK
jgi:hypothetical protein